LGRHRTSILSKRKQNINLTVAVIIDSIALRLESNGLRGACVESDGVLLPKRGFTNIFREEYAVVNLDRLATLGETEITPEVLKKAGVVNGKSPVKILGSGELKTAITVHAHKFSKSAQEKITKAGGKFEVLQ